MKHKGVYLLPMIALVSFFATYAAEDDKLVPYRLLTTVGIPGGLVGFDISWVDSESGRYYLADRGNAAATPPVSPSIDVIDTKHNQFLYKIPLSSAGNGVVAIGGSSDDESDQAGVLVVGTADSHALSIDLAHPFATPLAGEHQRESSRG